MINVLKLIIKIGSLIIKKVLNNQFSINSNKSKKILIGHAGV